MALAERNLRFNALRKFHADEAGQEGGGSGGLNAQLFINFSRTYSVIKLLS